MLFIHFTLWDVIKGCILWPFLFVYRLFIVLKNKKKQNEVFNNLYDLVDEVKYFAEYFGKKPIDLQRYKIQNVKFQEHIDFKYGNRDSTRNKNGNIIIMLMRDDNSIYLGNGAGSRYLYLDRDSINYEDIVHFMYKSIERHSLNEDIHVYLKRYYEWKKNIINPILSKYYINENDFYDLRRALIILSHENTHPRWEKAKDELVNSLEGETRAMQFVKEIGDQYSSKVVFDALESSRNSY